MDNAKQYFAANYAEAREGFLAAVRRRGLAVASEAHSLKGAQGEELATDTAWIGPRDALNRGYGTQMMTQAIDAAFADPLVKAIVIDPLNTNTDAHRFYQRMGFEVVGRRMFDEDDCLVHRLERARWEART